MRTLLAVSLASFASLAGCSQSELAATSTPAPETGAVTSELVTNFCATGDVSSTDWYSGAPFPFPAAVDHLENVEIKWNDYYFFAWGIGDNNTVQYLYRVNYVDHAQFLAQMTTAMLAATGNTAKTWGSQGVGGHCCVGPNPPVGPGGGLDEWFPATYVRRMIQFTNTLNDTSSYMRLGMQSIQGQATAK